VIAHGFDYTSPGELFLHKPKGGGGRKPIGYRKKAAPLPMQPLLRLAS
jgi:hypothetical protein